MVLRGSAGFCVVLWGSAWFCGVLRGSAWFCGVLQGSASETSEILRLSAFAWVNGMPRVTSVGLCTAVYLFTVSSNWEMRLITQSLHGLHISYLFRLHDEASHH